MSAAVTPALRATVDGRGVDVLALRVAQRFNAPAQCELTLGQPAGRIGARLTVSVTGDPYDLFDGEITAVELRRGPDGTTVVRVRGYDLLHRLRRRQSSRVLEQVSAADVAETLTAGTGLVVDAPPEPVFARVVQHRQHDLGLLVETAARAGRLVTVDRAALRLTTLAGGDELVPLRFGHELYEVDAETNVDRAAASVTAVGWNAATAETLTSRADNPRSGRPGALTGGDVTLVGHTAGAAHDLAGTAQLALDVRTAHTLVIRGTAAGDARLRPGTRVQASGIQPDLDGVHVLCEVVHTVDVDGYRSAFSTEPPELPDDPGGVSITLGRVLAVDDPEARGRVRVALPAYGDPDIGWLGVVCPGAGRGRGLVALPDVGDTVAVAVPYARSDAALVLGSLYGALAPPDPGVEDAAVKRWSLRTADGQSLVLDDAAHAMRLANRDGSAVELAPDGVRITAKADLTIDAAGHAVTIRARAVDFENAPL